MCLNNLDINQNEDHLLLSSLSMQVDTIFFNLRKADQIIRQELNLLDQNEMGLLSQKSMPAINGSKIKTMIYKIPLQHLLMDEYLMYMLDNQTHNLFTMIEKYNDYIVQRDEAKADHDYLKLSRINARLSYYIRRLGAMIHHLNIHLNLVTVLLMNASRERVLS